MDFKLSSCLLFDVTFLTVPVSDLHEPPLSFAIQLLLMEYPNERVKVQLRYHKRFQQYLKFALVSMSRDSAGWPVCVLFGRKF